jgi:hypothetical protein
VKGGADELGYSAKMKVVRKNVSRLFVMIFSGKHMQFVACRSTPSACILWKICIHPSAVKLTEQWTFLV